MDRYTNNNIINDTSMPLQSQIRSWNTPTTYIFGVEIVMTKAVSLSFISAIARKAAAQD